ncbi:MAG: amidohydrolase family protein, partial [Dehalococcoidia bacterium]
MAKLPIIDADSHVEECEATWSYLERKYQDRRPIHLDLSGTPGLPRNDSYWLIDGRIHARPGMPGSTQSGSPVSSTLARGKSFTTGSQTLDDVPERLRDMDKLGIDISVLFPTAVLTHLTPDPGFEAALMGSYNAWLAERCSQAPERLKWGALIPFRNVPEAVTEVRRAKELGAVAVFSLGTAADKLLHHPIHDPIYAALVDHDLPLCVHVGWSHPGLLESCNDVYESFMISFTMPVMMGFFSMTGGGILDRFPRLRVAFLEAGGDWLPYTVDRMRRYYEVT